MISPCGSLRRSAGGARKAGALRARKTVGLVSSAAENAQGTAGCARSPFASLSLAAGRRSLDGGLLERPEVPLAGRALGAVADLHRRAVLDLRDVVGRHREDDAARVAVGLVAADD